MNVFYNWKTNKAILLHPPSKLGITSSVIVNYSFSKGAAQMFEKLLMSP